jgi:hypothetical protein
MITDTTELLSPSDAEAMLTRNQNNRPINWRKVEEYAKIMRDGGWQLTPQGIILDGEGNVLTGQTRLWGIVYSGVTVYMRVSRGSRPESASVIDRGRPQSARDLATRKTERRHSPVEASLARCVCVLRGQLKPTADEISEVLTEKSDVMKRLLRDCAGGKKEKKLLMILGAIADQSRTADEAGALTYRASILADQLEQALLPYSISGLWGRGVGFGMAMSKAHDLVQKR